MVQSVRNHRSRWARHVFVSDGILDMLASREDTETLPQCLRDRWDHDAECKQLYKRHKLCAMLICVDCFRDPTRCSPAAML
jgi:hypothetical protein